MAFLGDDCFLEDKEIRFDFRWLNLLPELQPSSEKILVPDLVPVQVLQPSSGSARKSGSRQATI